jgi:hypothetical protein
MTLSCTPQKASFSGLSLTVPILIVAGIFTVRQTVRLFAPLEDFERGTILSKCTLEVLDSVAKEVCSIGLYKVKSKLKSTLWDQTSKLLATTHTRQQVSLLTLPFLPTSTRMIESRAWASSNEIASCPSGKDIADPSRSAVLPSPLLHPPRCVKWSSPVSTTYADRKDDALPEYNEYPQRSSGSVRFRTIPQVFMYHPADPIILSRRGGVCDSNNRWSDHRHGGSSTDSGGGDTSPRPPHRQGSFQRPNVVAALALLDTARVLLDQLEYSAK